MASGDSPVVARRRVRLALRRAREAKELTQGDVAEAMEWSLSKVMRIENGDVAISINDLRPLLTFLGITDRARVDELVQDARLSLSRRRQDWWAEPRFRDRLTPALRQLIQFELEAVAVYHFHTFIVPGRLQTPAYARAILSRYHNELSTDEIEARLEARIRRRNDLLARKDRPKLFLLLDESVLLREIGGPQVLGEQLTDLLRLAKERRLYFRVVPFALADAPITLIGSYDLLQLGEEDGSTDNAIIYRESDFDEIVQDGKKIAQHREQFELLWNAALDEPTSAQLIEAHAKTALAKASERSPS
jgi:transcriptional regulator with XRE-family HTH domain